MTPAEISLYYQDLLIAQYRNGVKAQGMIDAMVSEVIADNVISSVRDAFDLDTAVGDQLDVLGAYRGVQRTLFGFNLTKVYFSLPAHNDSDKGTVKGFSTASMSDNQVTWYWLRRQDINAVAYMMNDNEYRAVIQFAVAVNASNLSIADIDAILFDFFGVYVRLADNGNMTITYNDSPTDPSNIFSLVNEAGLLPQPAGVTVLVTNI